MRQLQHTWLTITVLCSLTGLDHTGADAAGTAFQHGYEWVYYGRVAQYAEDIAFSLVTFTVPPNTQRAEFHVELMGGPSKAEEGKVLLSLRHAAIPVLQSYNETVPDSYVLPVDQQTYEVTNQTDVFLTLNSPAPGRVCLVASMLNPLKDVIEDLRWGERMFGDVVMIVAANYTLRSSVASLSMDEISKINSAEGLTQVYSFRVPGFTMLYSVTISNCHHKSNGSNCPVIMTAADSLAAHDKSTVSIDCRQQGIQCLLTVPSPTLEQDHYLTFAFNSTGKDQNITFDVSFDVQGCALERVPNGGLNDVIGNAVPSEDTFTVNYPDDQSDTGDKHTVSDTPSNAQTKTITPSMYRNLTGVHQAKPLCVNLGYLGRGGHAEEEASFSFGAVFGPWSKEGKIFSHFDVAVPDFSSEVRTFILQDSLDSGGTLYIMAELQNKDWQGVVQVCVMAHRLAMDGSVEKCSSGALLTLNATASSKERHNVSSQAYVPYPTSGSWYMAMQSQCRGPKPCETLPTVRLWVGLTQCAPNSCGRYGKCQIYTDANLVFAGCYCYAGYRGLLCNDDTYSLSDGDQLRAVYLLTLSNLAFLPAIGLALYRRYFTLAAVFFFNAFFSAVYHACDTSEVFQTCIMDYRTLAFCDFFGSVLSFYSVLLYMARIPANCRSFILVLGALVIAVFQNSDRHNDIAHILPLAAAGCILVVSWALVMWRRKRLFPSRRRYLFFILPGVVLAVTGIGVNYGLMWHKSTYQYTHSFWHVSLMIAPCFLMPPRAKGLSGNKRGLSISAQDIIRSGQHQQSEPLLSQQEDDEPAMFDASMNSLNAGQNLLI